MAGEHEGPGPPSSRAGPWRGTVADTPETDPHQAPRDGKGRVPVRQVRVEGERGQVLEFEHLPAEGAAAVRLDVVREIGFFRFDVCPICLAPDPGTREHVPPASLGGSVATFVCQRCNNELGSRIEVDLLDWRDGAVRGARVAADALPGQRRIERLLRRTTSDGEFVLVPDGRYEPRLSDMLGIGEFQLTIQPPDPARYRLAALKHAYLAACLNRQAVPDTASAEQIRNDLVAARDAPRDGAFPRSPYADALPMWRSYRQPASPVLAVGLADAGRDDERREVMILLAGSVALAWPMPDFSPSL